LSSNLHSRAYITTSLNYFWKINASSKSLPCWFLLISMLRNLNHLNNLDCKTPHVTTKTPKGLNSGKTWKFVSSLNITTFKLVFSSKNNILIFVTQSWLLIISTNLAWNNLDSIKRQYKISAKKCNTYNILKSLNFSYNSANSFSFYFFLEYL